MGRGAAAWLPVFLFVTMSGSTAHQMGGGFHNVPNPPKPRGTVAAVYDLLDRVLPGAASHFRLSLGACPGGAAPPCYHLSDADANEGGQAKIVVTGTGASELSAALGHYFRHFCNMTIGWPRGGGSNLFLPSPWPRIGLAGGETKRRVVPWSYMMNVVAHSYSFAWYSCTSPVHPRACTRVLVAACTACARATRRVRRRRSVSALRGCPPASPIVPIQAAAAPSPPRRPPHRTGTGPCRDWPHSHVS